MMCFLVRKMYKRNYGILIRVMFTVYIYFYQFQIEVPYSDESRIICITSLGIQLFVDDWGVQLPPKRKVFRFHENHSQKVSQDPWGIRTILKPIW